MHRDRSKPRLDDRDDLRRHLGALDSLDRMLSHATDSEAAEAVTDEPTLSDEEIEAAIDVFDNA